MMAQLCIEVPARLVLRFLVLRAGLVLAAGTVGCSDSVADLPDMADPPPAILSVMLNDSVGPLLKRLSISLDSPGSIEVEYRTEASARLRVVSSGLSSHDVLLARLLPGEVYDYSVRAVSSAGEYSEPFLGSFSTDELPADIAALGLSARGVPTHELTVLEIRRGGDQTFSGYVAIDQDAQVVWYWRIVGSPHGWTRRDNGNFVFLNANKTLEEVAPDQRVVSQMSTEGLPEGAVPHHDLAATHGGTVLVLMRDPREFDGTTLFGEAVWEWDPDLGTLEKRWASFDFFLPDVFRSPKSRDGDFFHGNSLTIGPRGNVVGSFHFQNMVFSIASDFASIEWMLGGPVSTYSLNGPTAFSGQHTATELPDNRVLLFDNGADRSDDDKYSRALELELDSLSGEARVLWQFRPQKDNYARGISSSQRFENGNTLVAFGLPLGSAGPNSGPIEVFEVTSENEVLWHLAVEGGVPSMYRATAVDNIAGEEAVLEGLFPAN